MSLCYTSLTGLQRVDKLSKIIYVPTLDMKGALFVNISEILECTASLWGSFHHILVWKIEYELVNEQNSFGNIEHNENLTDNKLPGTKG